MSRPVLLALLVVVVGLPQLVARSDGDAPSVTSRTVTSPEKEISLVHEVTLDAPVAKVWAAYTTADGYTAWAAPRAEVDWRIGGTIRTRYDRTGKIGDPGTVVLHILASVPEELLILRAEVAENWPDVLKKDADRLQNVVVFEKLGETRTKIRSYGVGYRDTEELRAMLGFFDRANTQVMQALAKYVEDGVRAYGGGGGGE